MDINKHGGYSPPRAPRTDHRVRRVVKFRNPHSVGKDITSEIWLNSLSLWDNYGDSTAYLYDYLLGLSREELYLLYERHFERGGGGISYDRPGRQKLLLYLCSCLFVFLSFHFHSKEIWLNSLSLWDNYGDSTAYLYDYLLGLSREELYLNNKDPYERLGDFICRVHSFLTNSSSSGPSTLVASLIHYSIISVVKTVHVFVCLRICQKILDTGVIVRTPAIQKQMDELISLATYLERCILHLGKLVCRIFGFGNQSPDFYLFQHCLFRVSNIDYILDYLSSASHKLATVFTTKMNDRLKYFNWLAWSISAICIGDLAQAIVSGKGGEEFLRTCLWTVCVGSSSLVLQIPSYESRPLQQLLTYHDNEHRRLCRMFQLQTANGKLIR